jgi:hypothetical protein
VPPKELVAAIKRAPSLRGMILGYIAEEKFEEHLRQDLKGITDITKHDDHDRTKNKSDRSFAYKGRVYAIQLKSMQTNSINFDRRTGALQADVQNDASDSRKVKLPSGRSFVTTCYLRDEYDILAVPLFPFTGDWTFAYKRNRDCRATSCKKYSAKDREQFLATTEKLHFPLDEAEGWTTDLYSLLDETLGVPVQETTGEPEAVRETKLARRGATILEEGDEDG